MNDTLAALRTLLPPGLFSDAELAELAPLCELRHYEAGVALINEGDLPDGRVLFLCEGAVSVSIQGRYILTLDRQGDAVGEMGLISAAPRSATVTTDRPSSFLLMDTAASTTPERDPDHKFRYYLSRLLNSILTDKLRRTSHRAQLYEDMASRSREVEADRERLQEDIGRYLGEISLYTQLVSSARDTIVVTDVQGRVLNANPALEGTFGLRPRDAVGLAADELLRLPGDGSGGAWATMREGAEAGGWSGEVWLQQGPQAPVPADCSVSVVDGPEGQRLAYSVMLRDSRERKAYEAEILRQRQALERAYRDLQETDRIKTNFLRLVSHELRTPLTSIVAYAETLTTEGLVDPEEQPQFLRVIHSEAQKLNAMVQRVLTVLRLQSGEMPLDLRERMPTEVVRTQVERVRELAEARGLSLSFEAPAEPCPLLCDAELLGEALYQVLDNAVKFTERGGVTVTLLQEGARSLLSVADTGKGIGNMNYTALLQQFNRGEAADHQGLGLGLPLCALIVQAHGGSLALEQGVPEGTRVTLALPHDAAATTGTPA